MEVLVTGASGFVGTSLCQELVARGDTVYGTIRTTQQASQLPNGVRPVVIKSLADLHEMNGLPKSLNAVVHLAARVHQMRETAVDPLAAFREENTLLTARLARWSAKHGVKRFVFLSSVKVNGEGQGYLEPRHVYSEQDCPSPKDPYGVSKEEAEQLLRAIATETGMETVILRPTLIYGAKVRANFLQLMKLIKTGIPLPFTSVSNKRSLLYLGNLTNAITLSLTHTQAANETFLLSDGEDLSTPELIRGLAEAMQLPARLFAVPPSVLGCMGKITRTSPAVQRMLGTLQINSHKIRETLDWRPPFTVRDGLRATAEWYLKSGRGERQLRRIA